MKLLILFGKEFYDHKTSLIRRHIVNELLIREDIDAVLTGQGWPTYDETKSLKQNLEESFPDRDVIYWYKPLGARHVLPLIDPKDRNGILAVEAFNEAWWPDMKAQKEVMAAGTDAVICHHMNDLRQFPDVKHLQYISHAADPVIFGKSFRKWDKRDIDIVFTGTVSEEYYPFRCRIHKLMKSGLFKGMKTRIVQHPGQRMISLEAAIDQEKRYAELLGRSKLAVVCSSNYKYGLSKYVEAAMAGAFPFGDVPPDFKHTIGPYMAAINEHMTDQQILEAARVAVEFPPKGLSRVAFEHHNLYDYVDEMLAFIEDCLNEKSGTVRSSTE